jgi:hypothetical protein
MKALLLIACSNRKVKAGGLMPAIERYDGGAYRVIRKMRRGEGFPRNVEVKILSAKMGLIDGSKRIPYYDQRMGKQRAEELRPKVRRELEKCLGKGKFSEIYIDLGHDYLPAIEGFTAPSGVSLLMARGRIGERLRSLKEWLLLMKG